MARQTRVKSWWLSVVDIVKNSDGHYRPVVDVVFPDELIANLVPNELQDPKKQRRRLVDASTNTKDVWDGKNGTGRLFKEAKNPFKRPFI